MAHNSFENTELHKNLEQLFEQFLDDSFMQSIKDIILELLEEKKSD